MKNKKVYITGIGSGVGAALAKKFHQDNYEVHGCVRNQTQAEKVLKSNFDFHIDIADLSQSEGVQVVSQSISKHAFNYIIFCAGYGKIGDFSSLSESDIHETFSVNTLSPIIITQQNIQALQNTKLVYISSVFAQIPFPGASVYSSSKSAISHFYKSLRNEYPKLSLLCLEIGAIKTPMHIKAGMEKSVGKDLQSATEKIYFTILKKEGLRSIYAGWNIQKYILPIIFYIQYLSKKYTGKKY